jgi:hypothetical protein
VWRVGRVFITQRVLRGGIEEHAVFPGNPLCAGQASATLITTGAERRVRGTRSFPGQSTVW